MSLKLAVVFIISTSIHSFAQRVNEHGLKMVSEIELLGKSGCGQKICFDYGQSGNLISIIVYDVYENNKLSLSASFKLRDNTLIHKHYGYLENYNEYVYEFDNNRHIVRYIVTPTNPNEQDYGLRWERLYTYNFDTFFQRWYLKEDIWKEYHLNNKSRNYILKHEGHTNKLNYVNGIVSTRDDIEKLYDFSNRNDTNISLGFILNTFNHFEDDYYFRMTEWMDCRNEYMLKDSSINKYEYFYENENLIKIQVYQFGNLQQVINIKYLH